MKLEVSTLSLYVTKKLLKSILLIILGISVLVFVVDFSDIAQDAKEIGVGAKIAFKVTILKLPSFVESVLQFIVLMSALFTLSALSKNNEITVMKISRISLIRLLKLPVFTMFLIGIISVFLINPLSSYSNRISNNLKNRYFKNEVEDFVESLSGLWLKQESITMEEGKIKNDGNIVIRARKVYKNRILFKDAMLIYTDLDNNFIKRINAEKLQLGDDGFWTGINVFIFTEREKAKHLPEIKIPTNLTRNFVLEKIKHEYESLENISIWEIPKILRGSKMSGVDTNRFKARLFYLLSLPFVFISMVYFAAFFAVNQNRFNKNAVMIVFGILTGFVVYISHNVLFQLTVAGKMSILSGIIFPVIMYFMISVSLVIKKEELNNLKVMRWRDMFLLR